jgi:integrase
MSIDLTQLQPEQLAELKQAILRAPDPVRKRKPRKKDSIKYLSEEQIERFFFVIDNPRDVAIFRVIASTYAETFVRDTPAQPR